MIFSYSYVMPIHFIKGDATNPIDYNDKREQIKLIVHICNDVNRFGKGFVAALAKKWPQTKASFHAMTNPMLGDVDFCWIKDSELCVANMIAQHNIYCVYDKKTRQKIPPIRYEALRSCLKRVSDEVLTLTAYHPNTEITVHMPRIGCGLAGGKWELVEPILKETV